MKGISTVVYSETVLSYCYFHINMYSTAFTVCVCTGDFFHVFIIPIGQTNLITLLMMLLLIAHKYSVEVP